MQWVKRTRKVGGLPRLAMLVLCWRCAAAIQLPAALASACSRVPATSFQAPQRCGRAVSPRAAGTGMHGRKWASGAGAWPHEHAQHWLPGSRPLSMRPFSILMHRGKERGAWAATFAGANGDANPVRACWVRCVEGEPHLSLAIEVGGKLSVLHRMQEDPVQTTLDRLRKLVQERTKKRGEGARAGAKQKKEKKPKGKGKGRQRQAEAAAASEAAAGEAAAEAAAEAAQVVAAGAWQGDAPDGDEVPDADAPIWVADPGGKAVSEESLNRDVLTNGHVLHLGGHAYEIRCNHPSVKSILVRQRPVAGFAIVPEYSCEFHSSVNLTWWRLEGGASEGEDDVSRVCVGHGISYTPTHADVGKLLAVDIVPTRAAEEGEGEGDTRTHTHTQIVYGRPEGVVLEYSVAAPPDLSVHAQRLSLRPGSTRMEKAAGGAGGVGGWPLRVVSYNILADAYASTKFAREQLYAYCPAEATLCVLSQRCVYCPNFMCTAPQLYAYCPAEAHRCSQVFSFMTVSSIYARALTFEIYFFARRWVLTTESSLLRGRCVATKQMCCACRRCRVMCFKDTSSLC